MPQEPEQLDGESKDVWGERLEKLGQEFPEALSEDKVDSEKLKKLVGEEHVAEGERYNFSWAGKSKAFEEVKQQTTRTLKPDKSESKNFDDTDNIFIEGENLEALKILQKSYHSSVKMIYIDPPYNTGKDFVYKDSWQMSRQDYEEEANNVDEEGNLKEGLVKNTKSGRYHSHWLNMMYPRLYLARNLLQENGVIFVSIDDNEAHHLRMIMDEIFGEDNFMADIVWNSTKSVTNTALISNNHTHNLVYAKSKKYFKENRKEFRLDEVVDGFENPDDDPRGPWKADPFEVGGWRPNQQYEIKNPKTGEVYTPKEGNSWKNDYETYKKLKEEDRIVFGKTGKGAPKRKRFLEEAKERGKVSKDLWTEVDSTRNATMNLRDIMEVDVFDNPKPVSLITKMIQLGTNNGSTVLDFFAGSGTTAHAVMKQNAADGGSRRCISVQLPEETDEHSEAREAGYHDIAEIARERIRRAGDQIKEEHEDDEGFDPDNFDDGFKAFEISDSNFKQWIRESLEDEEVLQKKLEDMLENTKEGAKEEFMLYELMLKLGVDLNTETEERGRYYLLSGGDYAVSLADKVDEGLADDVLDEDPSVFVCLDSAFEGNDELKTNAALQMQDAGIEFKVV